MKQLEEKTWKTSVAARVAGEDLKPGDYIALSRETLELPSFFWCGTSTMGSQDEPVRIHLLSRDSGSPFKIITVCLPFIYAKKPSGAIVTFDLRRSELLRLDASKGRKVFKLLKAKAT